MGITISLLLFAVGAIMRYAVTVSGDGFDVQTTGVILMLVGVAGAIFSAINWASWGGIGNRGASASGTRETVVTEREVP